jgi:hypothetical protein
MLILQLVLLVYYDHGAHRSQNGDKACDDDIEELAHWENDQIESDSETKLAVPRVAHSHRLLINNLQLLGICHLVTILP